MNRRSKEAVVSTDALSLLCEDSRLNMITKHRSILYRLHACTSYYFLFHLSPRFSISIFYKKMVPKEETKNPPKNYRTKIQQKAAL